MKKTLLLLFISTGLISTNSYSQKLGCSTLEYDFANQKPLHLKGFDSTKSRGLADNYYLWENGATITVKFLSGSKTLQEKVKYIAKQWENYANIKFNFVTSGPSNLRIMLGKGLGHNSFIGTINNLIEQDKQTMNLDTVDLAQDLALYGTTLHEFGHALGLLHEHSNPISGIKWNKEKIYKEYWDNYGWNKDKVDGQVFAVYNENYTNGTKYDSKSIMHYSIDAWETIDGYSVPWNYSLSEGDKALISALYPKTGARKNEVPRFAIANFTKMEVSKNDSRGGISIYPAFDVSAAGKSGKVYFCAVFYDKDGVGLRDTDGMYAYGNTVAAVSSVFLIPGDKVSYNKSSKDFEMFIPYNQLPLSSGKNDLIIKFIAVHATDHGEVKFLYDSKPLSYSLVR